MDVGGFVDWLLKLIFDERAKYLTLLVGAVVFALLAKKLSTEWTSAYRLILRFCRGLGTGGHWSAAARVAQLMVTDRKLFGEEKLTLLRRARILCENEIFDPRPDRKSAGEGKRVSVRVDLGGRRILKKNKNKQIK